MTATSEGSFLAILDTKPNEKAGDRVVVAQSVDAVAKVDVQITRRPRANAVPGFGG